MRQDSILKNSPPRCLKRSPLLDAEVDDNRLVTSISPHRGKVPKNCLTQAFYWVKYWEFIPGIVDGVSTQMAFLITVGRSADFGI